MPCSGCSALHGVNPNLKKKKNDASSYQWKQRKKKYEELWIKIRDLIRSITKNLYDYDEKYMKIKFDSDDNWPLYTIEIPIVTIAVGAAFHENNKYYHKFY